jgi:hypothetical protein
MNNVFTGHQSHQLTGAYFFGIASCIEKRTMKFKESFVIWPCQLNLVIRGKIRTFVNGYTKKLKKFFVKVFVARI